jgi:hypothetical protein
MGPVVVIVILPLPELLVEQVNVIGNAVVVEELIELLVVDPVRPLDLAVEMGRANAVVSETTSQSRRARLNRRAYSVPNRSVQRRMASCETSIPRASINSETSRRLTRKR